MGKIVGFYVMPHPPILIPEVGHGEEYIIRNLQRGVFVSLKKFGKLRGCIGTIFPV